ESRLKEVAEKYGVKAVASEEIYDVDMDIYAPCALGATVNSETIERFNCAVIAGSGNNQLGDERIHGILLMRKGILYAPDYVINSGGLINVYGELGGKYNKERSLQAVEKIYGITKSIFKLAKEEQIPPYLAANKIGEKRIEDALAAKN